MPNFSFNRIACDSRLAWSLQEILMFIRFCLGIQKSLDIEDDDVLYSEVSQLLFADNPARSRQSVQADAASRHGVTWPSGGA